METGERFGTGASSTDGGTAAKAAHAPHTLPTPELISYIAGRAAYLVDRQVELAKAEIRENIRAELGMAVWLGVAATCAVVGVSLLCVSLVLGLGAAGIVSAWLASVLFGGVLLFTSILAALVGWGKRVTSPLAATRHALQETLEWAKTRLARGAS